MFNLRIHFSMIFGPSRKSVLDRRVQDSRDAEQEGCRSRGMQERRDSIDEGCRKGGI